MKKIVSKAALGLLVGGAVLSAFAGGPDVPPAPMVTPGFYIGAGGSWNTIDAENTFSVNETWKVAVPAAGYNVGDVVTGSSKVHYLHRNRLAPMFQAGYWAPIDSDWLWGLQANYKYLDHVDVVGLDQLGNVATVLAGTLSVVAGNSTYRNMTAKFKLTHELLLLAYLGMQFNKGYVYLGAGPAAFWVTDSLSMHGIIGSGNANGAATGVISNTGEHKETLWGGAAQIGWNYYFKPTWFLGLSYTYAVSAKKSFTLFDGKAGDYNQNFDQIEDIKNKVNIKINADKCVTVQEVMFSLNKVFAF